MPAFAADRANCSPQGEYFQIQDDYLDAFADPATLGKVGTDIQDSKCSWLVVQALALATPAQRALLTAHYGRHDEGSVRAVKGLYVELALEERFRALEQESYAHITALVEKAVADTHIPSAVFTSLLAKIYKREK